MKSRQFLFAALCGLGAVSMAVAGEGQAKPFKPGDQIVCTSATRLLRGRSTLATVNEGQALRVLKVEGPWVGTAVSVNGRTIGGWISSKQLATPQEYQAMRPTTRRGYSYQPAPVYGSPDYGLSTYGGTFIMSETPYGRPYWRADRKVIGY